MNEVDKKNLFVIVWPILLVTASSMYQVGVSSAELETLAQNQAELRPLVAQVAVLENTANKTKEDLQEIKHDVKIIRDYLMSDSAK